MRLRPQYPARYGVSYGRSGSMRRSPTTSRVLRASDHRLLAAHCMLGLLLAACDAEPSSPELHGRASGLTFSLWSDDFETSQTYTVIGPGTFTRPTTMPHGGMFSGLLQRNHTGTVEIQKQAINTL